ncbi:Saposin B-type domain-containing protein [Mycena indigotica]|uniref:Sphingomyelin phosphodiesterase n=1 Tax=Mycena indigotica TaxID=2126181 RepID=A0A8H6W412_9AGAR|nr:Saposin B-type domain-containing protein [Mycena indigotica]KAF7304142.1 Saposin B-type domain-containing protein [Mycena indigotica]
MRPSILLAAVAAESIRAILPRATVDCPSCLGLLSQLQPLAKSSTDALVVQLTGLCIQLGAAPADVCSGVVNGAGPVLATALRQINVTGPTGERLCGALMNVCTTKTPVPFTVPFPKPPPVHPKVWKSRGRVPFRVAHLSDVHIDRGYTPGADANCTKPLCCRVFPDSPPTPSAPAGPNGNAHCDSPVSLAESMLAAVEHLQPRFSIFTGDVAERLVWLVNQSDVSTDLHDFNVEMARTLSAPVFPSVGNHDTSPVNLFARSTSNTVNNSQWVFDIDGRDWARWIRPAAASQVTHHSGSYSALVPGTQLRILALNTQYWYIQNFWLYDSDTFQPDPNGLFSFMVSQLQQAEDAGERVWIVQHIPSGGSDFSVDSSNHYDQVLQRYKHTIAGLFFGHTHGDQFQIAYSNYSARTAENAVSVAMIGPSLTPNSGNPAFKLYEVDPDTYELLDSTVYFTNTSDGAFQSSPTWAPLYSARAAYGPLVDPPLPKNAPLGPVFWHNLTVAFLANQPLFDAYIARISRGASASVCSDADGCRNRTVCDLRAMRSQDNCDVPTPGFSLRRRMEGEDSGLVETKCEGVGLADVFRAMAGWA